MDDGLDAGTRRPRPTVRRGAIWTERALLGLIVCTLAGTANLLVAIHRRAALTTAPMADQATAAAQPAGPPALAETERKAAADPGTPKPGAELPAPKPVDMLPPPEDPTKKALAGLTKSMAGEVEAAQEADQRAAALETARQAAAAESKRWKRREMLVRQQIAGLSARADQLETAATAIDAERDVLAKERDALKAALFKAGQRSGFAVLPYKGPNGTWRRPIVLECTAGAVKLQPKGATFTAMDLSPLINPRLSPLVRAVAHEMLHIKDSDTPDGAAAVPYLVFLVRPNGIRPYYEARSCLEPLGIAFGYELIEQDLAVDIPDFDNLATWDGSVPLDLPLESAPRAKLNIAMNSPPDPANATAKRSCANQSGSSGSPAKASRDGQLSAGEPGNADDSSPEDFVWPRRGAQTGAKDRAASLPGNGTEKGGKGDRDGTGADAQNTDDFPNGLPSSDGTGGPLGGQSPLTAGAESNEMTSARGGAGRYQVGGFGSNLSRGNGTAPRQSPGSDSVPFLPRGNGLSLGSSPGSGIPGSSSPAGNGFGPGLSPAGVSGSNLISGGGAGGSGFAPGDGISPGEARGGMAGPGSSAASGAGSNFGSATGSGSGLSQGSGSVPGSSPGGGAGSSSGSPTGSSSGLLQGGGSMPSSSPAGGAGSSFGSQTGNGSSAPQTGGSDSRLPSGGGQARSVASGNGTTGAGTPGSLTPGGNLSLPAGSASATNSGVIGAQGNGVNALPDLEPAGDGGALPPLPPSAVSQSGGARGADSGAGGPSPGSPPSQSGSGATALTGADPAPANTEDVGQYQGTTTGPTAETPPASVDPGAGTSGSPARTGASVGLSGAETGSNVGSNPPGSTASSQPGPGQPAGATGGIESSNPAGSTPPGSVSSSPPSSGQPASSAGSSPPSYSSSASSGQGSSTTSAGGQPARGFKSPRGSHIVKFLSGIAGAGDAI